MACMYEIESAPFIDLPSQLQDEIFLRLPIRSLLLCKCVCKFFRTLIQNPDFDHTRRSLKRFIPNACTCTTELLLVQSDHDIYIVSIDKTTDDVISRTPLTTQIPNISDLFLVGSCNDLVCFSARAKNKWDHMLLLWNPLTRETKYLPKPEEGGEYWYKYGSCMEFCFVPETNDYIVLIIGSPNERDHRIYAAVYKMSTDSWTIRGGNIPKINCSVPDLNHQMTSVFVDGCFYWGTTGSNGCNILSYSLKHDKFKVMWNLNLNLNLNLNPIAGDELESKNTFNLVVIEKSLGIMCWNYEGEGQDRIFRLKYFEELGNEWFWVPYYKNLSSPWPLLGNWKDRLITKDSSSNLYLYDILSQERKQWFPQSGLPRLCSFLDTMAP